MANSYMKLDEFLNAELFYNKAIDIQPNIAFYYLNKASS